MNRLERQTWIVPHKNQFEHFSTIPVQEYLKGNTPQGFPWCEVSSLDFFQKGVHVGDISRQEIDRTIGYNASSFFSFITTLDRSPKVQRMGFYVDDKPVGFTYAHTFCRDHLKWVAGQEDEAKKLCGEVDLIYVLPNFRNLGLSTLMYSLATLRLLSENPSYIAAHVADKTGKITKILKDAGYEFKGYGKGYADTDEYLKSFTCAEDKKEFVEYLEMKIRRKLEGME